MKRNAADVVIVGGGAIGCSIARELSRNGADVMVAERDAPGRRATWAAAGMLSPLGEALDAGPFLELADASLTRFAAFARSLRDETGIDVEYRTNGRLHVSLGDGDDELDHINESPAAARFGVSRMDGDAARRLEPELSDDVTGAVLIERDHRVNNRLLAQALLASATAFGTAFRTGSAVTTLLDDGGAVAGVRLASGEQIDAKTVVLAAGAWSGHVGGLPRELPLRPIKGQMFAVDGRARYGSRSHEPALHRVVFSRGCYIIPREDGRLLAGATVEDAGFRTGPTPRGMARLMAAAAAVLPVIHDLPLVETWAGFRPATPDHLPIIGTDPDMRGLIYATGHYRNGILLAPITAACVAALVEGVAPPMQLEPFRVGRFGSESLLG
jgi:glycine oxidase